MRKIFKTGNSLAVTMPKKDLEVLGLKKGDGVEVSADSEYRKIIIRPAGHREQLPLGLKIRKKL